MRLALALDGPGQPCKLTLGSAVIDSDPETATVTLAGGKTLHADLLVGADGVKVCSSSKIPSAKEPKNTGYYACRFTLPIDETVVNDPELRWIPIRDMKVLNVAAVCHVSCW